ncbi:hypothetical protein FHR20_000769 [Sphingomonas leidyi]|uniref:Uncharacterized protein n=1 Tax=Sphingomonas leidyi TaxID=68569 RepID=A0A7X5ZUX6_9SPHN|nr:hypothetical protein [Sphingomonas leidyi]NIJ63838.1 hypothetical protein [Sphingomonas leidyi]
MSDAAILADEDPREYHSSFNLALDSAAGTAFKWLILGHLFFIAGLCVLTLANVANAAVWLTPLLTLPLVWAGRGHKLAMKVAVLIVGLTFAHWAGAQLANQVNASTDPMRFGLIGGGVGAGLALLFVLGSGLGRRGIAPVIFAVFGTAMLAGLGALVVYLYITTGSTSETFPGNWVQLLKIYTPWQIGFAFVLAKVLRPDGAVIEEE